MNFLYLLNYFMSASLIALISLEAGMAFLYLFKYKKNKSLIPESFKHLWAMVGTFAVFYLINLESTYPKILSTLAHIYEVPLILAAMILLFKNSFVAYSYHLNDKRKEKLFQQIYAIATVLLVFAVTGVLMSAFLGTAVNFNAQTVDLLRMLFNWKTISVFVAGFIVSVFSAYQKGFKKFIGPLAIMIIVFVAGILRYPYMFGGAANMLDYITNSGVITTTNIIIAALGYVLLATVFYLTRKVTKISNNAKKKKN